MNKIIPTLFISMIIMNSASAESCASYIGEIFDGDLDAYRAAVRGIRIYNRADHQYTSITLNPYYLSSNPFYPGASNPAIDASNPYKTVFGMDYRGLGVGAGRSVDGYFKEVFSDRVDGVVDTSILSIYESGQVAIRLSSWGDVSYDLTELDCYRINENNQQFVLTGKENSPGSTTLWLFSIDSMGRG
jgi:hypothetical protein